uniref:Replication stress response regulator SDE2 n=1 Tax=Nannospalax galili TaxID=1026970 RepID=A0A8C6RYG5_NANGA
MAEPGVLAWLRGPGTRCKALPCASARCSVRDVISRHCQNQEIPVDCFFVKCNGVLIGTNDTVQHGAVYSLEPRLHGGKGGFGSMLRALGAQIEKTTNREACRDLSGRRLRDVNHEKAMAEWVKQQAEREAEKEQKRLERLQRKLAEPKPCFTSPDYQRQCHEMAERLEDSVLKGMQAASSKTVSAEISETRKRPNKSKPDHGASTKRRKCFWLGMEGLEAASESNSGSSDDENEEAPGTSGLSCCAPESGRDDMEVAVGCPRSPRGTGELSTDSESTPKSQNSEADPGQCIFEDTCAELGETSTKDRSEGKMIIETEEPLGRRETENPEAIEKDQETEEMSEGHKTTMVASGNDGKNIPVTKPEGSSFGDMALHQEALDLLAFSSSAELELLGLERLKCELMALGLKCGGTLQERAARLFSVRGLAKEHIDPALFAKPSKGKKK